MIKNLEDMSVEDIKIALKKAVQDKDGLIYKQMYDFLGFKTPPIQDLYQKGAEEEAHLNELVANYEEEDERRAQESPGKTRKKRLIRKPYSIRQHDIDVGIVGYAQVREINFDEGNIREEYLRHLASFDSKRLAAGEEPFEVARSVYEAARARLQEYEGKISEIVNGTP